MSDFSDTHGIQLVLFSRDPRSELSKGGRSQCIHRARLSLSLAYFNNESHRRWRSVLVRASATIWGCAARGGWLLFFLSPNERSTMQYVLVSCAGRLCQSVDKHEKKKEKNNKKKNVVRRKLQFRFRWRL